MEDGTDPRPIVEGQVIRLDYATLRDTVFKDCKMVFAGGQSPSLFNCAFVGCEFVLEGAAENTQIFLGSLARSGATELVVKQMLGIDNWAPKDG